MQIFEIISQDKLNELVSFNSNFLEANVLNILLLLSGLVYTLKKFLGSVLLDRQNKVLFAIQESEERLEQANIRLKEAEKQFTQTQMIVNQIIEEAELTAKRVHQSILEQGKSDILKLKASSKTSIKSAENQVSLQIQQQITALAIKKVRNVLKNSVTPKVQGQIIDNNIIQLQDKIYI
uniref:ATP synthase subunit b, chloroplastic n=1 Tax=Bostrychia simpliciuscula TaxID=324754 RepID=A0A1Z1M8I6_9FLOR|nr:ATP synthase CF0 subunit I [Bostrychia simpliciuscula]ARW62074.1 ATP synthase CF0 subunit I [Bostrychia simpliciuscula]